MTKPKFRFEKPIVKSKIEPVSKNVLWYFSQQKKGLTINTIKEYVKAQGWVDLFDTAPIELSEITFTENGIYENNEDGWDKVIVDVPPIELTSTTFTSSGQYTNPDGGWNNVTVDIPLNSITITENGSYNASIGGWNAIDVNIPREYPPNNEIWYTSINNEICNIANIPSEYTLISNTYSEGKGIFTFDKPITDLSGFVFSSEFFTTLTFPEGHVSGTFCTIFDCYNLNHYNIPEGIQDLPIQTQSIEYIKLPSSFSQFDINCTIWSNYKKLEVNHNNTKFLDFNCNALLQETLLGITLLTGSDNTIIPDIVTTIGDKAFKGKNIENLYIPDSVNTIGSYAFSDNVNLKSIRIGKNVQTIGTDIFKNCANIEYVKWDSETTNFITSTDSEYIFESSKSNIKNVIFGDNVTCINDFFGYLDGLENISIPKNISNIKTGAFRHCTSLKNVFWNAESCESLDYNAFYTIQKITFGEGVKIIPKNLSDALSSHIQSIIIPDNVKEIGDNAFSGTTIDIFTLGSGIEKMGLHTMFKINLLRIKNIVNWLSVPKTSYIQALSFKYLLEENGYNILTTLTLPSGITRLEDWSFGSGVITTVVIPESVTYIGSWALPRSNTIKCYAVVPPTLKESFNTYYTKNIYVPSESVELYKNATNWSVHANIIKALT